MNTPGIISNPSRRQVLCGLVVTLVAGGAVTTACGSGGSQQAAGPASQSQAAAPGASVVKLADVPVGGGVVVEGPSGLGKLLVVRPTSGEVKAFSAVCPHQGVTVAAPEGDTVTCPGHGSKFDAATGALKRGPATTGLTVVQVKVSGADVVTA